MLTASSKFSSIFAEDKKIIIITGPTACGKTSLSLDFASKLLAIGLNPAIYNIDCLQIYREIPILTAQPTATEKQICPHHLYGFLPYKSNFSVAQYLEILVAKLKQDLANNVKPILVGGTGLYIKSLLYGIGRMPKITDATKQESEDLLQQGKEQFYQRAIKLDGLIAEKLHKNDVKRVMRAYMVKKQTGRSIFDFQKDRQKFFDIEDFHLVIIEQEREKTYKNADERFLQMLEQGLIDEVRNIMKIDKYQTYQAYTAHSLPEIAEFLQGNITKTQMIAKSQQNIRNYIKRQHTFMKHQYHQSNKLCISKIPAPLTLPTPSIPSTPLIP